ncbi:MAG TPA: hypothetical protein VLC10_00845 [Patescibacteria group bacterium]|nr:hypothetical protein [Patescibacteria group bacterium]
MASFLPAVLASFLVAGVPARTEENASDDWHYGVDVLVRGVVFGNEPSLIFSEDSRNAATSSATSPLRAEFRGRMRAHSRFLHLEVEPYTWVPQAGIYVTVAGIEFCTLTPLTDRLRIGFYHHSSHNFSDGSYGRGISLNAFMADAEPVRGAVDLFGSPLRYRLRMYGHAYLPGSVGSPYEPNGGYSFDPKDGGRTAWRAGLNLDVAHANLRGGCSAATASERFLPASMRATCQAMLSPGPRFLGALGQHVFAGPFAAYRMNFAYADRYGGGEFSGGLLIDLVAAENMF